MPDEAKRSHPASAKTARDERNIDQLEDDGRGWCGIRTYISGPAAISPGHQAEYKSNVTLDSDSGCKTAEIDEVLWTISDAPPAYKDCIHIFQQSSESCKVKVEAGVQSGFQFTLHAAPRGHANGKGSNARVACQVSKSDAQIINVS